MPDKQIYEYAIIRVVPKVEREEFINVGVVLFSKKLKFLKTLYKVDEMRLKALSDTLDIEEVAQYLKAFQQISEGSAEGGPIAKLDQPSRFRWLTATRSTIVQASKVHPGFCGEPEQALEKLFTQMVG
ncbi:DUF3037 domain-containing protein [Flavisolibacter tropicus]|uniref:DUF3037 domain-containing protein n=1 Tax=Flavisolibacter tropicus TaxID=1492898 RepID=A0A172TR20_9BACT|nr:DUF3037 domain-containing protein [Flavisolibacter tropicus]ANE49448.1 hypothetical protein SY85_01970 [Flavisolibacter tropicus]